jgi:peroxiredoxin
MRRAVALIALAFAPPVHADSLGKEAPSFALPDTEGKKVSLDDFRDKKAVVVLFLGTQCPINNAYMPRLAELNEEYAGKGVQFLALNSNQHDDAKAIADHARKHKLPFPVLRDAGQLVADRFGAERVPEAFLLDAKRVVRYQGRIDDQFGIGFMKTAPTRRDLAEAIDDLLAGNEVRTKTTPVAGCYITRAARPKDDAAITYGGQIARIVQERCAECHRPGQIGPMPLLSYDDVSSWAAMIKEVVAAKRMPPWYADPAHGVFSNKRSLSHEERDTLLAWIDAGCPEGDKSAAPAPKKYVEGWSIGKPDAVFSMTRPFDVPAKAPKAGIRYQNFSVPTNFTEDKWIQAAEAKPGNLGVVHHIIVYMRTDAKRPRGEDGIGNGFLVAYVPGDAGIRFPPGMAKKIPKGATLVFQMHYTPNGVAGTDQSSVGLVFADPPKLEMRTRAIAQQLLLIPPGADSHKVESRSTFKKDAVVYSLFPHMHLRGKSFEYRVVYPDGKTETVLSVPKYDFNWQDTYVFKEPLRLPAGARLECTAHYDNSSGNRSNPDPKAWVHWGDQTWEEMMIGFVDYAYVEAENDLPLE